MESTMYIIILKASSYVIIPRTNENNHLIDNETKLVASAYSYTSPEVKSK